jgi:WD40 repeat protein
MMLIKCWLVALLAIICLQIACSRTLGLPSYEDITEQTEYTVLRFPDTHFENVLWRADGAIVTMQSELVRPLRQPYSFEEDNNLSYLDLPQGSNCKHAKYRFPTQLPDGRLGLIKWCVTDNVFTDTSYMVAYDWKTSEIEQIVQNPLRHFDIAQCFSWNPDMTKGIQRVSNGLTGTLNWLTAAGPEPVKITLREGDRVWDLAKDYEENGSREGGTISCPTWSPSGDKIAVFVSFDAMGVEGIPRLDKPSSLMLIDPVSGDSESVLAGVYYAIPKWSPDGRKIAFTGYLENGLRNYQENEPYGLWVFDIETRLLQLIAKEKYYEDFAWSPDSQRLAVIWCDHLDCEESEEREIREYKLPE